MEEDAAAGQQQHEDEKDEGIIPVKSLADVGITPEWTHVEPEAVRLLLRWYRRQCRVGRKADALEALSALMLSLIHI